MVDIVNLGVIALMVGVLAVAVAGAREELGTAGSPGPEMDSLAASTEDDGIALPSKEVQEDPKDDESRDKHDDRDPDDDRHDEADDKRDRDDEPAEEDG